MSLVELQSMQFLQGTAANNYLWLIKDPLSIGYSMPSRGVYDMYPSG